MVHILRHRTVAWLAALLLAAIAPAPAHAQQPQWRDFLRRDEIEAVELSSNGHFLALAQRTAAGTVVSIRETGSLRETIRFDPGGLGEIAVLKWIDDDRLVIGANRADSRFRVALVEPAIYVVSRDGRSKERMPANFLATIEGDPEHLLVYRCTSTWDSDGCVDEVRKVQIGHTRSGGERIIAAPDSRAELLADRHGQVRFAISWNDSSQSRLHVHRGGSEGDGWALVNDAATTGLDTEPLGIDEDGKHAWLSSQRKQGPSAVERYSIADGSRDEAYVDPVSDPIWPILSFDGDTPIGAWYDPVKPRAVLWNADHPDVPVMRQVMAAFPGKVVAVASASADRNLAIVYVSSSTEPGDYYLFDRAARRASLLAYGAPWLTGKQVPASRGIDFTARDGLPLHGVLTLPASGPQENLPMVVLAHGGPYEVMETAAYDGEAALLASQGYAVLRVNFRGSGGYGREFVEKGYRQWGAAMQDDLTDATRWAIAQGIADPKRICLHGMSYGGYAALMGAVREPGLYRCVAGYAAPYDLAKMYKWGSIRRSDLGLKYLERVLGKDKAELAARSPAQQAAAIKVPVLLAHGRLDARVDVQHSRALAKAMRKAGVQAELVEYPNEGHWLAIEADQEDFYTRLLAFLAANTR